MHDYELKKLPAQELDSAIEKATLYRALNQPEEAESICHDVLAIDGKHQNALRVLGLAITDRFGEIVVGLFEEAMKTFEKLESEYDRVYHQGVAWERLGKAHLHRGEGHGALTALEHAIEHFERAEKSRHPATPIRSFGSIDAFACFARTSCSRTRSKRRIPARRASEIDEILARLLARMWRRGHPRAEPTRRAATSGCWSKRARRRGDHVGRSLRQSRAQLRGAVRLSRRR